MLQQGIYPTSGTNDADFSVLVNGATGIASACVGHSLIYNVFDSTTFKPWKNVDALGNNLFRFGSGSANCRPTRNYNFEFSYLTPASRKLMMDFMDSVPVGDYVVVRSIDYDYNNSFIPTWQADTALIWKSEIFVSLPPCSRIYATGFCQSAEVLGDDLQERSKWFYFPI